MIRLSLKRIPYWLVISFILVSCDRQSHEMNKYLTDAKQRIFGEPEKENIADIPMPKAMVYQGGAARSPFEESNSVSPENIQSPLNEFPLSALHFVGTVKQGNKIWGVILTPTNKIYKVTIDDKIGNQYGKIIHIYTDRIEVIEMITEGSNRSSQRLVTLQLKEKD